MVGMGLTFSAGVGVVASVAAIASWLFLGGGSFPELARVVVASSLWAFPIGVAFSGVVSVLARGRSFEELSLARFGALGAGAGLMLFGVLATNAWDAWSPATALGNAAIFVILGGGSAMSSLLLARKADASLAAGGEPPSLGESSRSPTRLGPDMRREPGSTGTTEHGG
jgi:hypothetical protein